MNRMEKKAARMKLLRLLDRKEDYSKETEQKIKELGFALAPDEVQKKGNRLTAEEVFYLKHHVPVIGVDETADRLSRPPGMILKAYEEQKVLAPAGRAHEKQLKRSVAHCKV
ncbi:hypothetical protein ACFFJY_07925 [Fictibacillus aquaticus]|uniref:Uncharacterized protein n=1 Tax=Fictibacillus aquaticus TaxID=2021314 RepID=A0A235F958_9BACL|nr:hypothetical protein [Fictibacillus aquaticus]OYD57891.1 hypothetical protein CGZ90_08295 [Fictibacillus aquaticus]